MSDADHTRMPPSAIASMLLTTAGRLQDLARSRTIPRAVRGRYELAPTVQAYVAHLTDQVRRAEVDGSGVVEARAALLRARAEAIQAATDQSDLPGRSPTTERA